MRAGEAACTLLRRDRVEEQLGDRNRHVHVELPEEGWMQHSKACEHGPGPEPQCRRLPGMELRTGLPHHLKVVDWRPRFAEQRQRLGLCVEGIEALGPTCNP